jgi:hypothetical protein
MTTLRSRVEKQRNQTNSNLLGMVLARKRQGPTSSLQAGDTLLGLSLELLKQSTPASILKTGPYFFWVGPPVKSQAPSFKLQASSFKLQA